MIGIFDSGIGGVTVLKEILKQIPNYHYVYYSDSFHNPYGDKTKLELLQIVNQVVQYLVNKGCQVIVIACNTASSICKDYLRSKYDIPILAIEPALKLAYEEANQENTLILATKGTTHSEHFLELYHKYNNQHMIIYECVGLADLIEQNNVLEIKKYLKEHLGRYHNIQHVILGCTHYPLIKKEIKEVLGEVNFYDGSMGVANHLKQVLLDIHLEEQEEKIEFIDSSSNNNKEQRFWEILKQK